MSRKYDVTANRERTCPVCKKNFIPAPYHIYRRKNKGKALVCSYHCMLNIGKEGKNNEG